MSAYAFAAGFEITSPPVARAKDPLPLTQSIELVNHHSQHAGRSSDNGAITLAGYQTQYEVLDMTLSGAQTPKTPNELEMSRPSSPRENAAITIVPSWGFPKMNKWRVLAACFVYFCNGLNDSAPGVLIPYIEKDYNIGYSIVSLIFVSTAIGFLLIAFFTDTLLSILGRAKTHMLSEAIIIAGNVVITTSPPFPVVVVAFFLIGLGEALNLALNNVFCANLANSTVILGATQGSYGLGGIVAPIIATSFVSKGVIWSRFYTIVLALRVICFFFVGWAFRNYENDVSSIPSSNTGRVADQQRGAELEAPTKMRQLKEAVHNRATIMGALFIFAYQGAEVSISGWVVSYLIAYRGGDPTKVGYVTAGFWAGITLGRFVLSHAAPRLGEKMFVYIVTAGAVALQLLVWFVPNVIGDAVAVSIVGLLLGPVYPCAQTIFTRLLPMKIQTTAVSFIASAGSSGGAVVPLMTGLLSQAVGTFVLHPMCIGMYAVMTACWLGLPKVVKRTE